ncbi:MAG: hypothetical protein HLUCCA12_05940 [Rhodobacteraceae bacterium HLUCCA12]|nr:MAG: hypothetical protein HLUCCA12_05940 [Rhodobacteraceae bacterium HLUCCA12]
MAQRTAKQDPAPDRAEIEAQFARIRDDIAALGGMMQAYGRDRLSGAQARAETLPDEALAELQRQLAALEGELKLKVRERPLQSLGLAALAGLVIGIFLRR